MTPGRAQEALEQEVRPKVPQLAALVVEDKAQKEAQKEGEGQEEAFETRRMPHGSRIKPPTGKKVLWGAVMGLTCRWPS
jgi:hypothetical protein